MSASTRHGPISVSASSLVAIARARVHSPAAWCARAAASARRRRSSCASGGVSRRACSASSAATAGAPRSKRLPDARRVAAATSDPARPSRAPGAGRARRVVDERPRSAHGRAAARRRGPVDDRREQGMREANRPRPRASITCAPTARLERVEGDAGALQQRIRRRAQRRRRARARRASTPGSPAIRARSSSSSVSGTGSGASGSTSHRERARNLQREERVSVRPLVDAEQRLARERPAEPVTQDPMQRADAERPHAQALDTLRARARARARTRRCGHLGESPCEQHENTGSRASLRSANASGARRGRVEPLDVVDRRPGADSRSLRSCSTSRTATASAR